MTRALRIGAGVACLAAAVVALLLAVDVRAWQGRVAADDLRFRNVPAAGDLWRPRELVPFGAARKLVALDDDLQYRRAVRRFRLGRPLDDRFDSATATDRIDAQVALSEAAHDLTGSRRRAQIANLLGVLQTALATRDPRVTRTFVQTAIASFVRASELDETDDSPKFNLEFALNQLKGQQEQQAPGSGRQGQRGQAGLNDLGRGY
jgi:hypothetical protein